MDRKQGLIEEYRSLRDEILRRQNARVLVLGFTLTAIGAVIGLSLGGKVPATQLPTFVFALSLFGLVLLLAALLFTIQNTQQIDIIASYISTFIEPEIDGIQWECKWRAYREIRALTPKLGRMPLGTSKPLAVYYGVLTATMCAVPIVVGVRDHFIAYVFIFLLALPCLLCSANLYLRFTAGWKVNWAILDPAEPSDDASTELPTADRFNDTSHVT